MKPRITFTLTVAELVKSFGSATNTRPKVLATSATTRHPGVLLASVLFILTANAAVLADPVSFERDVYPLLEKRCNGCHHADKVSGGLDLTRLSTMLRGGDDLGSAIIPGKPDESPLIKVLHEGSDYFMPKDGEPLPADEIALLKNWISQGALDDTPKFADEQIAFFEKEVRPILFERCFKCHAGEDAESGLQLTSRHGILRGGDRGPAAIAGDPARSLLIAAVKHEGGLKMPRGGDRLTDAQIASLETWIRNGLPWPGNSRVLTREKQFTISDADRNHWAFRALPTNPRSWSIDSTLEKRHQSAGLTPAPRADRHRLLRRLTYDLIGYPPTMAEIEAFVADESPDAYMNVVNRLLDDELFGSRWGRHWLDYSRNGANGQSNRGPEMDPDRYARWVTQCFNEDRPYDWFVRVHLAGDRMPSPDGTGYSVDQAIAAAVPLNGPRTFARAETDTFILMDKLDEGVEFLGRSLLGVSLECARCHDHKFDPVSQRDYYALLGIFQSSWYGPVPADMASPAAADASLALYRKLLQERARLEGLIRIAGTRKSIDGGQVRKQWYAERQAVLAPKEKRVVELEVAILEAELKTADEKIRADVRKTAIAKRASLTDFKPRFFDRVAFKELGYEIHGHKSQVGLIARATAANLPEVVQELETLDKFWRDETEEWLERHRFGGYLKADPEVADVAAWDDQIIRIQAQLDALAANQQVVRCEGGLRRSEELAVYMQEAKADQRAFYAELVPAYVGDARLLRRGDILEPAELVPRGTPEFFADPLAKIEGSGRLQLANWLTKTDSIQSALVARTAVNRVWQNLFGEALCRTPKELGRLGATPEMPELIDGLAAHLIESDWSLKSLIRTIVMSDAYTRSSMTTDANHTADRFNRYFAHQNVRRLQAEPILNTFATLSDGARRGLIQQQNLKASRTSDFLSNFDGPTTEDIIDQRTQSISATQALFLMNARNAYNDVASALRQRHRADKQSDLSSMLEPLFLEILSRPLTHADRALAEAFVIKRRRDTGGENLVEEIHEFIHLLLCSNELLYIE